MAKKSSEAFSWLDTPMSGQPLREPGVSEEAYEPGSSPGTSAPIPGVGQRPVRRRNRAKTGKRSDPNYVMAGAYIERGVRERVDNALANLRQPGEKKPEYSDLVQSLLIRWLQELEDGAE
ncbi:MAG: hypothetical protein ACR2N0_12435 [Rubrobacteraceae bacterium]